MIILADIHNNAMVARVQPPEANLTVSEAFKTELNILVNEGHPYIVVSFEDVIYVDSSFLGALVSSLKYAISKKADIVLAGLNKDIQNLFQLIRLDKAFKIYPTTAAAIAAR
jgi:anti-sigma B factor antagonist